MTERPPKSLRDHVRRLRRHAWLIGITSAVAVLTAVGLAVGQAKVYTASATIAFLDPTRNIGVIGGVGASESAEALTNAGVARITQRPTLALVKQQLGTPKSISGLQKEILTVIDPNSLLVTVTVSDQNPAFAAALANAVVQRTKAEVDATARNSYAQLVGQINLQYKTLTREQANNQLILTGLFDRQTAAEVLARSASEGEIESTAQTPSSPTSPKPVKDGIIGALLGLLLGLVLANVREALDRRLGSPSDIENHLGLPLVGHIREESLGKAPMAIEGRAQIDALDLEAFRILRTNVQFLEPGSPPRTVIVTSARPEEGKTTVACSLAFASAAAGRRTLLVEGDLRRPQFRERLGIAGSPGLTDFLTGTAEPEEVLQTVSVGVRQEGPTAKTNGSVNGAHESELSPATKDFGVLTCIAAGKHNPQPAELLASNRFRDFLAQVAKVYDLVVLDTSPLLPVADTLELISCVDAVLLCVRASRTKREEARAAKTALDRFPSRPMGLVVTGLRDPHEGGGYYYPYTYDYMPSEPVAASVER